MLSMTPRHRSRGVFAAFLSRRHVLPRACRGRQETEVEGSAASPMEWLGLDDRSHSEQPFLSRSD